ncbi:MAG: metal-dependent hydrolase [Planctomycetales bacterium]|nr:metal-dependent hydrolase [Planctomycetales bacterium]
MANFRTHITTSTVVGLGYGAYGFTLADMPPTSCAVAAGLCSIAGMLPDLDSDNGIPVRETFCFGSAVIPVLMLDRFMMMGFTHEDMVLASGAIYIFVRFFVSWIFKRYTVHRGMWHSLPACATCGLLAYMICTCEHDVRMYKAVAVVLGFLSHLILDEIYSVDLRNRRIKKSFGTALKMFSNKLWPNVSTYGKLTLLIVAVTVGERKFLEYFRDPANRFHYTAERIAREATEVVGSVLGHTHLSPTSHSPPDLLVPATEGGNPPPLIGHQPTPVSDSPSSPPYAPSFPANTGQNTGSSGFGGPLFSR